MNKPQNGFERKIQMASDKPTMSKNFLTQFQYLDIMSHSSLETDRRFNREDYYYDTSSFSLLKDQLSFRVRKTEMGVSLKFMDHRDYVEHPFSDEEVIEWEKSKKTKIPTSVFISAPLLGRTKKMDLTLVGMIYSIRALALDGSMVLDHNCFNGSEYVSYEVRLKECEQSVVGEFDKIMKTYVGTTMTNIIESKYQRLANVIRLQNQKKVAPAAAN
ncbi:MAG: hypothetical protein WC089_00320 [Candidatus Paceibacterota bacterium]